MPILQVRMRYSDGTTGHFGFPPPMILRYDSKAPRHLPRGLAATEGAIEKARRICRDHGIQLLVVSAPVAVRVLAPYLTFENPDDQEAYLPGNVTSAPDDFAGTIGDYCRQRGVEFVDLFPSLSDRAKRDNRDLYMNRDGHWDVGGHAVAAQAVLRWMNPAT